VPQDRNMNRWLVFAVKIVSIASCCVALSIAQNSNHVSGAAPGRILNRTRLVVQFSELENAWLDAIQKKNSSALDRLLDDSFQVWSADVPAPTPREDWEKSAFAAPAVPFRIQSMSARDVRSDLVIVNFQLLAPAQAGKKTRPAFYVVDVWSKNAEGWQCTDRYISPLFLPHATITARPTGKD
jgi:uncharacterized protein DUF4440